MIEPQNQVGASILKGSKLENYLALLQILSATRHPLKFSEIEKAAAIDQTVLEESLSFLLEKHVISQQQYGSSAAYSVAPLGAKLIRYFSSHTQLDR
jgi:predicted transcriptional regulator